MGKIKKLGIGLFFIINMFGNAQAIKHLENKDSISLATQYALVTQTEAYQELKKEYPGLQNIIENCKTNYNINLYTLISAIDMENPNGIKQFIDFISNETNYTNLLKIIKNDEEIKELIIEIKDNFFDKHGNYINKKDLDIKEYKNIHKFSEDFYRVFDSLITKTDISLSILVLMFIVILKKIVFGTRNDEKKSNSKNLINHGIEFEGGDGGGGE